MPRKHRSARERPAPGDAPERPKGVAPDWAATEGFTVRASTGEQGKTYRCPGCQQQIRPGLPHLVVMDEGDLGSRRHWHTPCWQREQRRRFGR